MPEPGETENGARTVIQIRSDSNADPRQAIVGTEIRPSPAESGNVGQIAVGTVLNHIYRVDRLIARGGMGEVYEGTNVNTDERVAIKIVLQQLAGDANVQTLFRNEARALTRLSHSALVQYRLLAQEPQLGLFYIVTEFIDGPLLAEVLETVHASPRQLVDLMRRLASGLAVAHELGKIHRDLSPDNIMLPHGRLDQAKIIDFGIVKNLEASNRDMPAKTIVGSGFAGKLAYVAPEQFGDTRHVGPWTDVYSLGLVILSVASRLTVDMGTNFAAAVESRRHIPDLSAIPVALRPVIARMLEPDRTKRFQTMHELLSALHQVERTLARSTPTATRDAINAGWSGLRNVAGRRVGIAAGVTLAIAVTAVIAVFVFQQSPSPVVKSIPPPPVAPASPLDRARIVAEHAAGSVACSWLQLDSMRWTGGHVYMPVSGVAEDPTLANALISKSLQARRLPAVVDTTAVGSVAPTACGLLHVLAGIRSSGFGPDPTLVVHGSPFHFEQTAEECKLTGNSQFAKVVADVAIGKKTDSALLLFQNDGQLRPFWKSRSELESLRPDTQPAVQSLGNESYRFTFCVDEHVAAGAAGYTGLILLTGNTLTEARLPMKTGLMAAVPSDWLAQFASRAVEKGWKARMAWFQIAPAAAKPVDNGNSLAPAQPPGIVGANADKRKAARSASAVARLAPRPLIQPPVQTPAPEPIFTPAQPIESTHTMPGYPQVALSLGEEGVVQMSVMIDEQGNVTDADVITSSGSRSLDAAAVSWVRRHWQYQPAKRDNKPVADKAQASMTFKIEKSHD